MDFAQTTLSGTESKSNEQLFTINLSTVWRSISKAAKVNPEQILMNGGHNPLTSEQVEITPRCHSGAGSIYFVKPQFLFIILPHREK